MRVYLADRNATYRGALARELTRRGARVEEFASGTDLFGRVITAGPDLVVMETDLDDMDGFQVFARLRRSRPDRPFPIVFLTAFDNPNVAGVCLRRGARAYLVKGLAAARVADELLDLLSDSDPLLGRTLAGALVWLQAHGKSGCLDVQLEDQHGYVLLHEGKVREAQWGSFQGDAALMLLAEQLDEAHFRFTEGLAPAPEAEPPAAGHGPDALAPLGAGTEAMVEGPEGAAARDGAATQGSEEAGLAPPRDLTQPTPRKGRAFIRRWRLGRGATVGIAAGFVLILTVGLAMPVLLPRLTGKAGETGSVKGGDEVEEASPPARHDRFSPEPPASQATAGTQGASRFGPPPARPREQAPDSAVHRDRALEVAAPAAKPPDVRAAPPTSRAARPATARRSEARPAAGAAPPEPGATVEAPEGEAVPADGAEREALASVKSGPGAAAPDREGGDADRRDLEAGGDSSPLVQRPVLIRYEAKAYYPPELKARGLGGSVLLRILVGTDGRPQRIQVENSSGDPALDAAAMAAAGTFLWEPARDALGPAQAWVTQAVSFDAGEVTPPKGQAELLPTPTVEQPAQPGGVSAYSLSALRGRPRLVPVDSRPSLRAPLRVRYPPLLAERKVKGAVTLWVLVGPSGAVEEVSVLRSSGHAELDSAATDAVRGASYLPARRNGAAVPSWVQQRVLGLCCRTPPSSR